jgi:hypothetical protein
MSNATATPNVNVTAASAHSDKVEAALSTAPTSFELDFDSDEPLKVCPMRNNGTDICESCQ